MKYSTYKNPLYEWWRRIRWEVHKRHQYICTDFDTWYRFAKWCEDHGYDENSKFHYSTKNPFTPDYLGTTRCENRDFEFIAYEANDPYELIIASAPYVEELAEIVTRMGYEYTVDSIYSALSRNKDERPIEERERGLIFEKIDLSDYDENEPFEERK